MLPILNWRPRHLDNGDTYMPTAVKIQIFNEFTVARLPVLQTYISAFGGSCV